MRSDAGLEFEEDARISQMFGLEQKGTNSFSGHERNHLFLNHARGEYSDVSGISGLDSDSDGRAWARIDYDNDGWQDIVVVNSNTPLLQLYRNRIGEVSPAAAENGFIAVRFVGGNQWPQAEEGLTARDGYGAKVHVRLGDDVLVREHHCGEGLATQNSSTLLIGIGERERADAIEVIWPSGARHERLDVEAGMRVTAYEDPSQSPNGKPFVLEPYARGRTIARATASGGRGAPEAALARASSNAQLTMLTTMATWCPKCKGELPQLTQLRSTFSETDLALRGVPIDPEDTREMLARYRDEFRPAYEMLDELTREEIVGIQGVVFRETQLEEALPATLVIDGSGEVVLAQAGVPSISQIKKLLAERSP